MEVGHDSWLTETGYVVLLWGERQWGTSTALPVKDFRWPTEDVSLDLYCWGFFFFFVLSVVPPEESFSLHLSRNLLMVFDVFEGVLNKWCSPLWVGVVVLVEVVVVVVVVVRGVLEWFLPLLSVRYLWAGWHSAHGNHLFSACFFAENLPLLSSRCPPPSSHLCLIVSISPHAVFNPISPFSYSFSPPPPLYLHIPLVMWNELRRDPISFLFVICDCGAVCLSRKQFHKKLSAFIQFSKKKTTNACSDYALFLRDCEPACGRLCVHTNVFL